MASTQVPLRRSARLAAKYGYVKNEEVKEDPIRTPQEEHILVSQFIKEMRKEKLRNANDGPKHTQITKSYYNIFETLYYKNTRIRVLTEMFYYLQSYGILILKQTKLRDIIQNKINEFKESVSLLPEDNKYKKRFLVVMDLLQLRINEYKN